MKSKIKIPLKVRLAKGGKKQKRPARNAFTLAKARPPEFAQAKSGAAGGSKKPDKRAKIKSIKKIEEIKTMATKEILEKVKKELADLTGFKSPSAIGFKKEGNELIATIEVIEKESIPDGMDVLGTYEVRVDQEGKILGYERTDLRKRIDTALSKEE